MPLLSTKGAASAQGFGVFKVNSVINYIEDVFSTYIYTGNSSTQTITNNINLSGKGGMVWGKSRSNSSDYELVDSARGLSYSLASNTTSAATAPGSVNSFTSSGFTLTNVGQTNISGQSEVSWSFCKQAKFFDVVTYTGTGVARTIAHNLGSTPGCIIVKCTSTGATDWRVYHVGLTSAAYAIQLNQTNAETNQPSIWNSTAPTSSVFSVGGDSSVNSNGDTYVAYLFASNAGGFGASGTDNVISCGSTLGGSSEITLGWEPQWLLYRSSNFTDDWHIIDNMRGATVGSSTYNTWSNLNANTTAAETNVTGTAGNPNIRFTATGFILGAISGTAIYIAIRRGPMKTPTLGTSVFMPLALNNGWPTFNTTNFPVDFQLTGMRNGGVYNALSVDRLRGTSTIPSDTNTYPDLITSAIYEENGTGAHMVASGWNNTGFETSITLALNVASWNFRRAPGFFDVVCYTGDGVLTGRQVNHNLGIAPELIILKARSNITSWTCYAAPLTASGRLILNSTAAVNTTTPALYWGNGTITVVPTSTVFTLGSDATAINQSGSTYVAYLFASCPGVSKVGSYTGNGSSQTIDCGFSTGSRFVMIKRTDSTGDWYVWDSARGIVAGNDPHLSLNTSAAEVTTDDSVDTDNSGFVVNQVSATDVNVTSATYIFLAIA